MKNKHLKVFLTVLLLPLLVVCLMAGDTPALAKAKKKKKNRVKTKIAVLELKATGVPTTLGDLLTEILTAEVRKLKKYNVIGKSDIKAMVGFEQEKQMLQCSDDTSCLAEIGGALGDDKIIIGNIGKLGRTFVVNIKLINIKKSQVEGHVYETIKGEEDLLITTVKNSVYHIFGIKEKKKKVGKLNLSAVKEIFHGATVMLDGKKVGMLPLEINAVPVGKKSIKITKKGYKPFKTSVQVNLEQTTSIAVKLISLKPVAKAQKKYKSIPGPWYSNIYAWSLLGVGIAAAGTGTVFGLQAQKANNTAMGDHGVYDITQPELKDAENKANQANFMFIGAAAAGVTSALLFYMNRGKNSKVELKEEKKSSLTITPFISAQATGVSGKINF